MFRNGEVRLRMEKGEDLAWAEMRPEKSSGDPPPFSEAGGRAVLATTVTAGLGIGLPPKIPSSSEAELEAEEPSGEEVG